MTKASVTRTTHETDITLTITPGSGESRIDTGVGFFDHMLTALAFHGGFTLDCTVRGDLQVDAHHTVEDTGLALGQAIKEALGDRLGIERFGSAYVPMDEALGFAALDISNRPFLQYEGTCIGVIGQYDTALNQEFLRALCQAAGLTLHVRMTGENTHHMTEALFKAVGRAFRQASALTGQGVPSTKGVL